MSKAKEHVMENKMSYIVGTILTGILAGGGGLALEMPSSEQIEKDLDELRLEVAQNYDQREQQYRQQQSYHKQKELERIDYELRGVSAEINRINQIPQYLKRNLIPEEEWQIEQLKIKWNLLQQRRSEVSN